MSRMLRLGAWSSLGVAALHVVIIIVGAPAYRYFGAGEELAQMAEAGSPDPALITLGITLVFAVFGWYGFAGAGLGGRPPGLRWGLVAISSIYLLRGLAVLPQSLALAQGQGSIPPKDLVFSLVSLVIGLFYAVGTQKTWTDLRSPTDP